MLRITLRDGEKVVINGAVLRSSGRAEIVVENSAAILRGRDVMSPEEADTPAKRLYFACMLAYLDPANLTRYQGRILSLFEDFVGALESPDAKEHCLSFARNVAYCDFYRALSDCRALIAYETTALGRLAPADAA
ncbi:flagellar biosynthesis repressor FlbT [Alteriqipengyuania lutimaris]|uniref:Flagellar biosynthesis repressor FlbT n=1 Tax=Alteriqipengyuania lutimaris TaxID=1538146 RepID=A0A395LNU8_9SPHN|nr:flagellar biosynthesis repressor FlbT [Alteriqipengyuania lutimaris]MBB3032455.1 flagellar protein FlbT [Alteriqipengyuania lutimaris]RDS78405.1 flagellar biosynthesis repressor FlbT [Alteriqipengyuania lutimaris]